MDRVPGNSPWGLAALFPAGTPGLLNPLCPTFLGSLACLYHPQIQGFSPRSGIIPLEEAGAGRNNPNPPRAGESTPGRVNAVIIMADKAQAGGRVNRSS